MTEDDHFRLVHNRAGVTIEVTGRVDDETAVALGHVLDDELRAGAVMTVRIDDAEISTIGWAVLERAARTSARRGARLRVEPDPGPDALPRRMARVWLDVIEAAGEQPRRAERP